MDRDQVRGQREDGAHRPRRKGRKQRLVTHGAAVHHDGAALGRLVVLASPQGQPEPGTSIPIDAVMMQYAVAAEHPAKRIVRNIGADLVWASPFVSHLARKTGNAVAETNAEREDGYLLARAHFVVDDVP